MVSFRRLCTVMAVLAVFAALASAQAPLTCSTNVAVTPTLRFEGYTEQTGDITITCSGGAAPTTGTTLPQVNITLFYNTTVTSRLLPTTSSSAISEALLLVNEPGSGLNATIATQLLCPTATTGCSTTAATGTQPFTGSAGQIYAAGSANVFQGIVNGNAVTFFGVPFLAPGTTGQTVLRVTNVRVNANNLGGAASNGTPVVASISNSGATSLGISNAFPTVGFVQSGLTASASSASNLNQCSTQTKTSVNTLTFSENFPTAFKTRIFAQANTSYAGQGIPGSSGVANQNIPGSIYNSESNFVYPIASGQTAGLADFGTRLRAVFNNVPSGVRLFVSTINVSNNANPIATPAVVGGNVQSQVFAQLVSSETVTDGNAGTSGFFPAVTATDNGPNGGNVPIAEIQVVNGSASAVWEVVNTNPNANESVKFAVYTTYVANVGQNTPAPGTATVNLSFAPAPPTYSASSSAAASSTLAIPRFIADASAARNIMVINICRTILLYPYVTNIAGFDTGLAIANTSTDPLTATVTSPQAGTCSLNWYQGATNPAPIVTPTIASGTIYTNLASTAVPGFNGYMIAICNFQYAHGFAFISDVGARNLAMGYLAVVIQDPGSGARTASPPCQGISGCTSGGEQGAH